MGDQRDYGDETKDKLPENVHIPHCEGDSRAFYGRDMATPAKDWLITFYDRRFLRGLRIESA